MSESTSEAVIACVGCASDCSVDSHTWEPGCLFNTDLDDPDSPEVGDWMPARER